MELDRGNYFLTATALKIWKENDVEEERRMFKCLSAEKDSYFRRVIFKKSSIPEFILKDFAEIAFVSVWVDLRAKAKAGVLNIDGEEYGAFFYKAFKNNYLKLVEKEKRKKGAERGFADTQPESYMTGQQEYLDAFSDSTQAVLDKMDEGCRELLTQKYVDGLSYDEIVEERKLRKEKKDINRESAVKILSRCRKRFLKIWNEFKKVKLAV